MVQKRSITGALAVAMLVACGGGDDPVEPPDSNNDGPVVSFEFMRGSWNVTGTFTTGTGTIPISGVATFSASINDRVVKERWVGTRGAAVVEAWSMFGRSDHTGLWLVVRADGGTGEFDVLEGSWAQSRGAFASRTDTRPDNGRDRVTIDSITDTSFHWVAERSADGGSTWSQYEVRRYTRASGTPSTATPPDPAPGCTAAEYRQFDFWIGSWSAGSGRNDIKRLLGGCLIEENWVDSEVGTSFNMYDPRSHRWTQVWIDTNGLTIFAQGGLIGSDMRLQDPQTSPTERITWSPLVNNRVRQHAEFSTNGGTTWSTRYDIIYIPR